MSEHISNEKNAMIQKLGTINQVEGFDPTPFAVEYTDLTTGESRKRLPVMIQMAWFRLKYPEGRIAVQVSRVKIALWLQPASTPVIRTDRTAIWQKLRPREGRMPPSRQFPQESGLKQLR